MKVRRSTEARTGVYQEVMETAKSALSAALSKDKAFTAQVREKAKGDLASLLDIVETGR